MPLRNKLAFLLIIVSLGFLYPGLSQPILTIKIGAVLPIIGNTTFYELTQNILQTVETLYENDNAIVAFLILFFSVIVPLIKAVILLIVIFFQKLKKRHDLYRFVYVISKWSMADVFVVGVFLAYLATKSNEAITAQLHAGFYYFLSYCLISIFAAQVMEVPKTINN
ncbi:paraquat-inducible protein A [Fulvivirgaceae bacterium BMA10]|uniref:Paraquat-inducible protein A n=1 Tax=Splendidivirga corallicola TaxID=3051826 RepID=A0ABT8KXK9_9BACT|nr:paraquat-inducible protein A [Fulvivirgaceae bacterium BMA10]